MNDWVTFYDNYWLPFFILTYFISRSEAYCKMACNRCNQDLFSAESMDLRTTLSLCKFVEKKPETIINHEETHRHDDKDLNPLTMIQEYQILYVTERDSK